MQIVLAVKFEAAAKAADKLDCIIEDPSPDDFR
jgi:hypothetical protein